MLLRHEMASLIQRMAPFLMLSYEYRFPLYWLLIEVVRCFLENCPTRSLVHGNVCVVYRLDLFKKIFFTTFKTN